MDVLVTLAVIAVIVVLIFDYTNGFHDASNIIATVIASARDDAGAGRHHRRDV